MHQDDFGVINFSKYSAKTKTRINLIITPIRRLTQEDTEENTSEYDTISILDDKIQHLQLRRNSFTNKKKIPKRLQLDTTVDTF